VGGPPACPTSTLDVYTASGYACTQANNIENYFFTYSTNGSQAASTITVMPGATDDSLTFGGFNPVTTGPEVDYFIGYNIDPAPVLGGDTISLDPFLNAVLTAWVCPGSVTPNGEGSTVTGTPYYIGNDTCSSAQPGFSGGTTSNILSSTETTSIVAIDPANIPNFVTTSNVGILLELQLMSDSGTGTLGNDPLLASSAPEPGSLLTVGSVLAAAILLRKLIQNRVRAR
jgi:hypothetical protein